MTTKNRIAETSSKGNQEKWLENGCWYKLDLFGYGGLAETVSPKLLKQTNAEEFGLRYVTYRMERLEVRRRVRNGCSSPNFLMPRESILTLADLFRKGIGSGWQDIVARQPNLFSKVRWIVEQTVRLTGLQFEFFCKHDSISRKVIASLQHGKLTVTAPNNCGCESVLLQSKAE